MGHHSQGGGLTLWLGMTFNDIFVSDQLRTALLAEATAHMSALETSHHTISWDGWMAELQDG